MSENDRKITQLLLANINEARMLVRSSSTSCERFKPIRLKSLKEARDHMKASNPRALSFNEELSSFNSSKTIKTAKELMSCTPTESSKFIIDESTCIKEESYQNKKTTKKEMQRGRRICNNEVKNTPTITFTKAIAELNKSNDKNKGTEKSEAEKAKITVREKELIAASPSVEHKNCERGAIKKQNSVICPAKTNYGIGDMSPILKFMDDKGIFGKKLTKNQEKGLIERLQGGLTFKFQGK